MNDTYDRELAGDACTFAQMTLGGDWCVRPLVAGSLQFWIGSHEEHYSFGVSLTTPGITAEQAAAKIVGAVRATMAKRDQG